MTSTEKKPRLVSLNSAFADQDLTEKFRNAFVQNQAFHQDVIQLNHQPFSYCVIDNFLVEQKDDRFCSQLINELKNIKMNQKNNDLYKFQQSDDLANVTLPSIEQFKQYLYNDFKDWLVNATNIQLSNKIDMTSSKYEYTDYLLCHDDDIHGTVEGRRIAFIYYLVPKNWQESDGGSLDLFETDEQNQPVRIVKSLVPKRNRLVFFEVTDKSYHQVAEVLNEHQQPRWSINGWLHGPVNHRSDPVEEPAEETKKPTEYQPIDLDRVNQTIAATYLKVETQYDVQMMFQENSETKLAEFFQNDYFQAMLNELKSETIQWKRRGPYNKRNYDVADVTSLPSALKNLVDLFGSEPMFTILGSLTGLTSENDDDQDEDSAYEPSPKKPKSSNETASSSSSLPRWSFELRRWKHSYYSLSFDTDSKDKNNDEGGLDVMIFFNSHSDDSEEAVGGGDVVYTIKNEDETLLRVVPDDNCLNLVYREDGNVLRFNKYVNHRQADDTFYEFFACYRDLDKFKID